jgi:Family of unknown function (DUF5675)
MDITITRTRRSPQCTEGELALDDDFFCYTLEPLAPIAAGTYTCRVVYSPKFQRNTPRLFGVPGFPLDDVEIHMGNFPDQTEGCILVGAVLATDFIGRSSQTFDDLLQKLPVSPTAFQVLIVDALAPGAPATA